MFHYIARIILKNRRFLLLCFGLVTVFFGYMASRITLSYDFAKVLPSNDPYFKEYEKFKETFGEDGSVMVIGVKDPDFYTVDKFNGWYDLSRSLREIDGIQAVVSVSDLYVVDTDRENKKFQLKPMVTGKVSDQRQLDSLKSVIDDLPFYKGMIYSQNGDATLMAVTFDKATLNTKSRIDIVDQVKTAAFEFGEKTGLDVHISGLPYIRTSITGKVASELKLFLFLAIFVCSAILYFFFRSHRVVFFSVLVVLTAVVWSVGTIVLFGYKITILTGLIPPLIIVIGIPNSILLLNKYHSEFRVHGNKIKSLARMIQRIGFTTFLANVTTAIGFGVFYFTNSNILMEFGLVAAINVMSTYLISIVLIPIVFSFLPPPDLKHVSHLKAPRMNRFLEGIDRLVHTHPTYILLSVFALIVVSLAGVTRLKSVGFVVDDLPKDDPVYVDMKFFEENFNGVLPLEISIDTREKGMALDQVNLQRISRLEKILKGYPELSKPIAVVDAIKFSYQSYRGGDPKYYLLPGSVDLAEMASYMETDGDQKTEMFRSFIDSSRQVTRVSVQMADVGSVKMEKILSELEPRVDSIFNPNEYDVAITGNSLIFLKGNQYLFTNLMESIILAIVLISVIMFMLFMSFRMISVSILPSLIPLLITAGIMGYFGITLKPSTILIFSIAFGISSDGTIYFLTKYRQELRNFPLSISKAVSLTIRETGMSMIYTAVILFCGFFIFSASGFGGTRSLGILISVTLLVAMLSNLVLLPALLITLEKRLTTRAFLSEPLIQIYNEEEDIELGNLEIKKVNLNKNVDDELLESQKEVEDT
jgi:predicted RND superfamily exporter protein